MVSFEALLNAVTLPGQFAAAVDLQGSETKDQWIAGDAEIHNRTDLLRTFDLGAECTDLQLVLAAYQKWGEDCPSFLLGEFAFAIWDASVRQLFCSCDHMGCRSLVYWTKASRIAVASDVKTIL
jgi:asparagine synthase (glutamine-hydrolysing)